MQPHWRDSERPGLSTSKPPLSHRSLLAAFACLWLASNSIADGFKPRDAPAHLAFVEAVKVVAAIASYVWPRQHDQHRTYQGIPLGEPRDSEDGAPDRQESEIASRSPVDGSKTRSTLYALAVAILCTSRKYLEGTSRSHADPLSVNMVLPIATLFTMVLLRFCLTRHFASCQYHAAFLLFFGLFIVRSSVAVQPLSQTMYSHLLGIAMLRSAALALTDAMYSTRSVASFHALNLTLFAISFGLQLAVLVKESFSGTVYDMSLLAGGHLSVIALPFLEAAADIVSLYVIFYFDAAVESIVSCASLSLMLLGMASVVLSPFVGVWAGCTIILLASGYYFWHQDRSEMAYLNQELKMSRGIIFLAVLALTALFAFNSPYPPLQPQALSSISGIFSTATTHPVCVRKTAPPSASRQYHAFDNVLLIVFFSHARYGGNMDYYKEVYSEYFPHMVFIGPASREDKGFNHSYDVIVDTYQSDENLTDPSFYKMAGRMAHHMLYTVLKEHDCGYDGYLWAPFDTLLNVPRLQQFNQGQFWLHSPWGEYVPNPALGSAHAYTNKTRHPPSMIISPDPAINQTEHWKGWGPDWWWGDPHVGLHVCMEAFNKAPLNMRERLAFLTDGQTRLIGGSVDTLYIPQRHRAKFVEILGLFLETNCFLEIATPTAAHLVLPPGELILYVDHWWIWTPPFNASFVRQKWKEGLEVDTFHTFHWGEKGPDGVWRGDHDNVQDVRLLLQESAKRQDIRFPKLTTGT